MGSGHTSLGDSVLGTARNAGIDQLLPSIAVLGVLLAEAAVFLGQSENALWLHLVTVLFCLFVVARRPAAAAVITPFALLPLLRVAYLGMPPFFEEPLYHLPLVYLPLLPAIYLVLRWDDELSIARSPRTAAIVGPAGIVAGALLAIGEYSLLQPDAIVPEWSAGWLLAAIVVLVGAAALVEELLFRGLLQRAFGARIGRWPGVAVASLLFAGMHSLYGSVTLLAYAALVGLVLGALYEYTDSVAVVTVTHGALNVFLFVVLPLHGEDLGIVLGA